MTTSTYPAGGSPTWVAVRGREAAEAAYGIVDAASPGVLVQPPRVAAPGWWLLDAELGPGGVDAVADQLAGFATGLMICGGVADVAVLTVFKDGRRVADVSFGVAAGFPGVPPSAGEDPALTDWIRRVSPRRLSAKAQAKLWEAVEGSNGLEIAEAVLRKLGFAVKGRGPGALCDGWAGDITPNHHIVGETRVDWLNVRWFVAYGQDDTGRWVGMWDLDAPGAAVHRWPRSIDGGAAARELQYQLVAVPILRATRLDGKRRWTPLVGEWSAAPAAFYHYSPDRRLSIVLASERPHTPWASVKPGYAHGVAHAAFTAVGYDNDTPSDVPIPDLATADRIAWGQVSLGVTARWGRDPSPWRDIPDDVPRGYLETAAWVRQQGLDLLEGDAR